ncbi:hypothetical protein [Halocatena marina]|uniref:Uncharacterized protein n=1 Tax=Halocatena marina TaxID=2934937 RepID=A0ABD5YUD9_9EURY
MWRSRVTKTPTADQSNDSANTVAPILTHISTDRHAQSRFFDTDSKEIDDDLDGLVTEVATIA